MCKEKIISSYSDEDENDYVEEIDDEVLSLGTVTTTSDQLLGTLMEQNQKIIEQNQLIIEQNQLIIDRNQQIIDQNQRLLDLIEELAKKIECILKSTSKE